MKPCVASFYSLFAVSLSRLYWLSCLWLFLVSFCHIAALLFIRVALFWKRDKKKKKKTFNDATVGTVAQLQQETVNRGLNLLYSAKYSIFTFPLTSIHWGCSAVCKSKNIQMAMTLDLQLECYLSTSHFNTLLWQKEGLHPEQVSQWWTGDWKWAERAQISCYCAVPPVHCLLRARCHQKGRGRPP